VNSKNSVNRRLFLRGLGGAALAAPFLPSVAERTAKAQGAVTDVPRRAIWFYTHFGTILENWLPDADTGALTAASFAGKNTELLGTMASKLLCVRGLRSYGGYTEGQSIDPHDQINGGKLTCAPLESSSKRIAVSHSIDHEIAKQLHPGTSPLVVSVGADQSKSIKDCISFSGPSTAYPATTNPNTVLSGLTNLFKDGGPVTPDDYRARQGKSILDLVRGDLESYERFNMSGLDKQRISDWKDLLTDVNTGTGMMNSECSEDWATTNLPKADLDKLSKPSGVGDGLATGFTLGSTLMFKLMALNMMCDATRSLVFTFPGYIVYNWDDVKTSKDHHGLSHRVGSCAVSGNCYVDGEGVGVVELIQRIDRFLVKKYFEMITIFDSIGEGDVKLLDNTATVWLHEMSDGGSHNTRNLPMLIAGGCGGKLKQGQIVNVDKVKLDKASGGIGKSLSACVTDLKGSFDGFSTGSSKGDVPMNKLLCTVANAVGCHEVDGTGPMTKWGMFDSAAGAMSGIKDPGELTTLKAT
jgi:hypothetical protein